MMAYNYYPTYYQPTPQNSIIWVSGESEAQMFPVGPNTAVPLWSRTESVVYVKTADATGKPTLKVYDLVERKPEENKTEFVTKAEIDALREALNALRTDVYGIAGKRKKEDED